MHGEGAVGVSADALAEPWANCRMFTLQQGTGLIITAGPGHIKGLRKGQTFCRSVTVSRPASTPTNSRTKGRVHTHLGTRSLGIYTPTKNMAALCSTTIYLEPIEICWQNRDIKELYGIASLCHCYIMRWQNIYTSLT